MDNPYNRREADASKEQYVVLLAAGPDGGYCTATRSAFDTLEDATHHARSIASCWVPVVARTIPQESDEDTRS